MSLQKIIEWDRKNLERLRRVQLPNGYKKIGLAVVILSFVALVIHKAADIDIDWLRQLIKNVLLIGLLMISIARRWNAILIGSIAASPLRLPMPIQQ